MALILLAFSANGTRRDTYGGKLRTEGIGDRVYRIFLTPTYLVI
ncbi:MAG: hypothetical protein V7L22_21315 [Nostoc sp.]